MKTKAKAQQLTNDLQINLNIVEVGVIIDVMIQGIKGLQKEAVSNDMYIQGETFHNKMEFAGEILRKFSELQLLSLCDRD